MSAVYTTVLPITFHQTHSNTDGYFRSFTQCLAPFKPRDRQKKLLIGSFYYPLVNVTKNYGKSPCY